MEIMYGGINNSVPTRLMSSISAAQDDVTLEDASVLPDAPNLLTMSMEDTAEVLLYTQKDGNILRGCTRGFGGTVAQAWPLGTLCYRAFTAEDYGRLIRNVEALEAAKVDTADLGTAAYANLGTAAANAARGNHKHNEYLTAETDPTVPAWAKAADKPTYTAGDVGAAAKSHTHTIANVTNLQSTLNGKAESSHTHTATEVGALPIGGGTLTGAVTASSPAIGTAGVRNIYAGTADMEAGVTALATGALYFVYE